MGAAPASPSARAPRAGGGSSARCGGTVSAALTPPCPGSAAPHAVCPAHPAPPQRAPCARASSSGGRRGACVPSSPPPPHAAPSRHARGRTHSSRSGGCAHPQLTRSCGGRAARRRGRAARASQHVQQLQPPHAAQLLGALPSPRRDCVMLEAGAAQPRPLPQASRSVAAAPAGIADAHGPHDFAARGGGGASGARARTRSPGLAAAAAGERHPRATTRRGCPRGPPRRLWRRGVGSDAGVQ